MSGERGGQRSDESKVEIPEDDTQKTREEQKPEERKYGGVFDDRTPRSGKH